MSSISNIFKQSNSLELPKLAKFLQKLRMPLPNDGKDKCKALVAPRVSQVLGQSALKLLQVPWMVALHHFFGARKVSFYLQKKKRVQEDTTFLKEEVNALLLTFALQLFTVQLTVVHSCGEKATFSSRLAVSRAFGI